MTRKDYQLIAGAINGASSVADVVDRLCFALESDNPRFDRATFYAACGLDDTWPRERPEKVPQSR